MNPVIEWSNELDDIISSYSDTVKNKETNDIKEAIIVLENYLSREDVMNHPMHFVIECFIQKVIKHLKNEIERRKMHDTV